ncbi:MAG: ABC transporter ATP-binding protein [Planctomycetes bacterium]|nr:ABC transporter ATP-binding protein [Planctomycetota bacterium]
MIELQQVNRVFEVGDQRVHALKDVDLRIGPGEYVSVMGPSGSGTSTLLNVIGLLDRPSSGRYLLEGQDTTLLGEAELARARRAKVGFVFQFFHLVPRLTALENVALPLALAGVPVAERHARAATALGAMGLTPRAHHRPDQLSGGQRQRVAIARATILRPAVILADEPTGNLDRHSSHEIVAVLEGLHHEGIALIVVTHDPELGARAHRRIQMDDGRIVADRTP